MPPDHDHHPDRERTVSAKKRWSDLTPSQRAGIVALGIAEVALTSIALADLARRPPGRVRGPRVLWAAGCFVQPVGPVAYLAFGRRTPPTDGGS